MNNLRTSLRFSLVGAVASAAILAVTSLPAQQQPAIQPRSAAAAPATPHAPFTREQLMTSTVHQAWELSGKNEANFYEMVEQIAEISAANRGITLPDDAAAGRRLGEYIKRTARADTDQLLYAVVDKAVRATSTQPVHAAGQPR